MLLYSQVTKWRVMAKGVTEALVSHSAETAQLRLRTEYSTAVCFADSTTFEALLPEGTPPMAQRFAAAQAERDRQVRVLLYTVTILLLR
jgi:hypothetical protein